MIDGAASSDEFLRHESWFSGGRGRGSRHFPWSLSSVLPLASPPTHSKTPQEF